MKEIAKSVRQRLLNISKQKQLDYNALLTRFFHERFLYRLSISPYYNVFYLKGGALLYALEAEFSRPTLDIDLLGIKIKNDKENLLSIFTEICQIVYADDGIVFDLQSIKVEEISIRKKYPGMRVFVTVFLDTIRQNLQIDIGFGDKANNQKISYPKLLDSLPNPDIYAYSLEYVVAEKFHAMIFLSELNSRYKDFYDVYMIITRQDLDKEKLSNAIKQTFQNRKTEIQHNHPLFSDNFAKDPNRNLQWKNFLKKIKTPDLDFSDVVTAITNRLAKILS